MLCLKLINDRNFWRLNASLDLVLASFSLLLFCQFCSRSFKMQNLSKNDFQTESIFENWAFPVFRKNWCLLVVFWKFQQIMVSFLLAKWWMIMLFKKWCYYSIWEMTFPIEFFTTDVLNPHTFVWCYSCRTCYWILEDSSCFRQALGNSIRLCKVPYASMISSWAAESSIISYIILKVTTRFPHISKLVTSKCPEIVYQYVCYFAVVAFEVQKRLQNLPKINYDLISHYQMMNDRVIFTKVPWLLKH